MNFILVGADMTLYYKYKHDAKVRADLAKADLPMNVVPEEVPVEEIERINILNASLKAMKLSCENVIQKAGLKDFITLVDGNKLIRNYTYPQKFIIKGDGQSASIAAASILAKVTRDRYMTELASEFPQYGWNRNAGYLTAEHLRAIDEYGLSKYHRPSFLRKHFEKQKQLSLF